MYLSKEVLTDRLAYWKDYLNNAPPSLNLSLDYPRSSIQTIEVAKKSCCLSKIISDRLKSLSQQKNVTLFMTLLAVFKILLYRHSGQEDIVIAIGIPDRHRLDVKNSIDFVINRQILRTHLETNLDLDSLLNRIREVILNVHLNQILPFDELIGKLKLEKNSIDDFNIQVCFNMLELAPPIIETSGLITELTTLTYKSSNFDLVLYVREKEQSIDLEWIYNNKLFSALTIERLIEHFQTLVVEIITNPKQSINNFHLVSELERKNLNKQQNLVIPIQKFDRFLRENIFQSIPQRFESQVKKYPEYIAVETQKYRWTYQTLNTKANTIAKALFNICGQNCPRVALLIEHDAPMIASIFGVLKAGRVYVALDPTYPYSRLKYILQDSECTVILTNNQNYNLAKNLSAGKIPLININKLELNDREDNLNLSLKPDSLAYILYTSGSTGQPKGVMQNHRNILHFIRNYTNNLHISPNDKLTLLASYSFDAAVIDIFSALLNGATLCPIDVKQEGLVNLANSLNRQKITIYHSTPTLYRHLLKSLPLNAESMPLFPNIRLMVLGGEEAVRKDVELYQQYFSDNCIFINGLGCSESSFHLQYLIDKQTRITKNSVPVGYLYEETEMLLLDRAGNNTEIYGEIAIRSPYLALGYWQKPELTSQVFLSDPDGGNRRIYRTGDLGYLRADGNLEYKGRKDFQVKIRGFRIELGEIENAILMHPKVSETVVVAQEDRVGNKILVAYLVASGVNTTELRDFLQEKLPDFMIPATFAWLDALPLTPNGKINRLDLPKPNSSIIRSTDNSSLPSNSIEETLATIWADLFEIQQANINDDFFELGGHSLLAVRLFTQIEKIFGKNLPLAILFKAPTIRQLASMIAREKTTEELWDCLVPIQTEGIKPPLFCMHGGGFNVLIYRHLAEYLGFDRPVYALQARGLDSKISPHSSIEEMAEDYIKRILTLQPEGPYFLAGLSNGGIIALEVAQQLRAQGKLVALVAMFDTYGPEKRQLLPPIPRLCSTLKYVVRYSLPRFWQKTTDNSFRLIVKELFNKLKRFSETIDNYNVEACIQQSNFVFKNDRAEPFSSKKLSLEISIENFRLFIIENSPLPLFKQRIQLEETEGSFALAMQKLHQKHHQAIEAYQPKSYQGKIVIFRATEQPPGYYYDSQFGWGTIALGELEIYDIPGFHVEIAESPMLAKQLQICLEKELKPRLL